MTTVTVALHGDLQPFLDGSRTFQVSSIRELMRALEGQLEGFRAYMTARALEGCQYQIIINGDRSLGEENLNDPLGIARVDIIPVLEGSGNTAKIIAGVVLIAAGVFTGGIGFISGATLILVGTSLALSGFMGLFNSPVNDATEDEDKKSFVFSGATNTGATNSRVPLILGSGFKGQGLIVGSLTVAASIRSFLIENDDDDQ